MPCHKDERDRAANGGTDAAANPPGNTGLPNEKIPGAIIAKKAPATPIVNPQAGTIRTNSGSTRTGQSRLTANRTLSRFVKIRLGLAHGRDPEFRAISLVQRPSSHFAARAMLPPSPG